MDGHALVQHVKSAVLGQLLGGKHSGHHASRQEHEKFGLAISENEDVPEPLEAWGSADQIIPQRGRKQLGGTLVFDVDLLPA
eukprot:7147272-Prymnesium_polylepis.1